MVLGIFRFKVSKKSVHSRATDLFFRFLKLEKNKGRCSSYSFVVAKLNSNRVKNQEMIKISRGQIVNKLRLQEVKNYNGHNHLVNDAISGKGDQAMAFLVKKGEIQFTEEEIEAELNFMVENNMLTIIQWESMLSILANAKNGRERVTNFLRRKRRIKIK